jgi:hypothetical protein
MEVVNNSRSKFCYYSSGGYYHCFLPHFASLSIHEQHHVPSDAASEVACVAVATQRVIWFSILSHSYVAFFISNLFKLCGCDSVGEPE